MNRRRVLSIAWTVFLVALLILGAVLTILCFASAVMTWGLV